jgi:ribosome maturation factor RimP
MSLEEEKIYNIVTAILEEKNFFLVDFILRGNPKQRIAEIYIDGGKDVTAEDLAEVSRLISSEIEEKQVTDSLYRLDVSSPGIDRPLKFLKQYPKHINRSFELTYNANDESKKFSGKLIRVDGETLVFLSGNNELSINFNNIKKAKVIVSFS